MAATGVTLQQLEDLVGRAEELRRRIHQAAESERPKGAPPIRFGLTQAAELIGRSFTAIRDAESKGKLPAPELGHTGRRLGFTLAQINAARDHFGTRMRRQPGDEAVVVAISNFKGGSSKTTTAVHLAQYLVIQGLRVLLVDSDSQGSATATFGYIPDDDIQLDETLYPYLIGEAQDLRYAVRGTKWDGLFLIPASLDLYGAEYGLAREITEDSRVLNRLRGGIAGIKDGYDVVLIDQPPALGMISLSVMRAADALLIPCPVGAYDLFSTISFLNMTQQVLASITTMLGPTEYRFLRLLITRLDESSEIQAAMTEVIPQHLGPYVLPVAVKKTAGLDRAGMKGRSLYEAGPEDIPPKTLKRGLASFDNAHEEILQLIRRCWPSHVESLRAQGQIL
jgi:chromosome partitioning protein